MNYLTAVQVLCFYARLIAKTGCATGMRDLSPLETAVTCPQVTFDGNDRHSGLRARAATIMVSLVRNRPFVGCNNRVGVTVAGIFLRRNAVRLTATNDEVEEHALALAQVLLTTAPITVWFARHTVRV